MVDHDTTKATELYNKKADELAKAKIELAKYKQSEKVTLSLEIVEEKPF